MAHDILVQMYGLHDDSFLKILIDAMIIIQLFKMHFLKHVFLGIIIFFFALILSIIALIKDLIKGIFRIP